MLFEFKILKRGSVTKFDENLFKFYVTADWMSVYIYLQTSRDTLKKGSDKITVFLIKLSFSR